MEYQEHKLVPILNANIAIGCLVYYVMELTPPLEVLMNIQVLST